MNHTQGPWKANGDTVVGDERNLAVAPAVAYVPNPAQGWKEVFANIRLMAAAPDLLAVCLTIVDQAVRLNVDLVFECEYCREYDIDETKVDHNEDCPVFLAQVAIDKATLPTVLF